MIITLRYLLLYLFLTSCMESSVTVSNLKEKNEVQSISAVTFLNADEINFGNLAANESITENLTLYANSDLSSMNFSFDSSSWILTSSTCGTSLKEGNSCTLSIQFSPLEIGNLSGNLTIDYIDFNGAGSAFFPLLGSGSVGMTISVTKVYPTESEWGDYIKNNNLAEDIYHQIGTACDGSETGKDACIHSGALLKVIVANINSCDGLTAEDTNDVFNWECLEENSGITFYSKNFNDNKGLKQLSSNGNWLPSRVSISNGSSDIILQSTSTKWWSDVQFVPLPSGSADLDSLEDPSNAIYYLSASRQDLGHAITASNVSVLIEDSAILSAATPTATNLTTNGQNFLWIEGSFSHDESGSSRVLSFTNTKYSRLQNVQATNSDIYNIDLNNFDYGIIKNISMSDSTQLNSSQLFLNNSDYNKIESISSDQSGSWAGNIRDSTYNEFYNYTAINYQFSALRFEGSSDYNYIENLTAKNGGIFGLFFDGGSYNSFKNIRGSQTQAVVAFLSDYNYGEDIYCYGSTQAVLFGNPATTGSYNSAKNLFAANCNSLVHFDEGANDNVVMNGIGINSSGNSISLNSFSNDPQRNTILNLVAVNSGGRGVNVDTNVNDNTFVNILTFANGVSGIRLNDSQDNRFYGTLWGDINSTLCEVSGSSNILVDTTCTATGSNGEAADNAIFYNNLDLTSSFIGPVTSDSSSSIDTNGETLFANLNIDNILELENNYRAWGPDDSNPFPDPTQQGTCSSGTCQIWDWSIIRNNNNPLYNKTNDVTGNNETFTSGLSCPSAVDGNNTAEDKMEFTFYSGINAVENLGDAIGNDDGICEASEECHNIFLINATEIFFDNIGDDDGLCESNEACLYTPNFGIDQGTGDYLNNSCLFINGPSVMNVTMYAYPQN